MHELEQLVIFWGWNEEGFSMFEDCTNSRTTDISKAARFNSEDAANLYLTNNYDVVPHARVITVIEAHDIEPKK